MRKLQWVLLKNATTKEGSNIVVNIEENNITNNTHCNLRVFRNNIYKTQFYLTRILYDLFA
jgi:hypothetical protein